MDDIAIIGMSCRFPGGAKSIQGLWDMVQKGSCAYSDFPEDRLNINGFYHPDGHRQGSLPFKGAHFLQDNIAAFDPAFFSMTSEEIRALDPQQRILLETSFEAIQSAGLRLEDLKGSDTSVYVGAFVRDYEQISLRDMDYQPRYASTGSGTAILSNRLSYVYDLRGASMTVDTGCSGSMVAVHLACQNLQAGNSRIAFAAGAGLILTPNTMMPMTALNFLSPDGKCFTFDARANGYGRGEGVGLVILKKLSEALKDNDPIRAVIRSSHLSQDGRTAGITLPNPDAQMFNIQKAYEKAGLDYNQTGYVECHGTGTQAGDCAELAAISQTLSLGRDPSHPLLVGSIKPNVGHLEGAAGVAGLIKGALVVEKGQIPPNANFESGNPDIKFKEWKVKVPTELNRTWPIPGIRRVSVNCFGFGGTNAHAVLDEGAFYRRRHRQRLRQKGSQLDPAARITCRQHGLPQLFLISGPNQPSMQRIIDTYVDSVPQMTLMDQKDLDDLAYTLACRRTQFATRSFAVADSRSKLHLSLKALTKHDFIEPRARLKPAFMFCGQGAQRAQMGRDLLVFPVFKQSLQNASRFLKENLGCHYDLLDEMMKDQRLSRITSPDVSQPATTALQVALVDLLTSFGVRPSSVVGHSSGEIAAAYACNFISRESAWTIAYRRGVRTFQLMKKTLKKTAMCFVSVSEEEAEGYLSGLTCSIDVVVACINSPTSVTLSGSEKDIESVVSHYNNCKIFCRLVPTGVAYHSHHMHQIKWEYLEDLRMLPAATHYDDCVMYSSLRARQVFASEMVSDYWVDNLVSPVRFSEATRAMVVEAQPDMIIELSPHATLKAFVDDILGTLPPSSSSLYASAMLRQGNEHGHLLNLIGSLWCHGYNVDLEKVVSRNTTVDGLDVLTDLPLHPWDHTQTFWHESSVTKDYRFRKFGRQDLIGAPCPDSASQEPRWRGFLRVSENPWLRDHQVQNTIIYPAAGMIATAIEGTRQHVTDQPGLTGFEVTDMKIERAMVIPETDYGLETMLHMKRTSPDTSTSELSFDWAIYSRMLNGVWTRHAHGHVRTVTAASAASMTSDIEATAKMVTSTPSTSIDPSHFYESLDLIGMNYGPTFRSIKTLTKGDKASIGTMAIPDTKSTMPHSYEFDHVVHPATMDAAIQLLFALDERAMVPTAIDTAFVSARKPTSTCLSGCAVAVSQGLRGAQATIAVTDGPWQDPIIVLRGLQLTAIASTECLPNHRNLCTELQWKPDYTTSSTSHFEELLELMTHKHARLNVLQIGGYAGHAMHTLSLLEPRDGYAPRLARYSICSASSDSIMPSIEAKFKDSPLWNLLEARDLSSDPEAMPKYHLILNISQVGGFQGLEHFLHPDGIILTKGAETADMASETDSACSVDDDAHEVQMGPIPDLRTKTDESPGLLEALLVHPVVGRLRPEGESVPVIILMPHDPPQCLRGLSENISSQLASIGVRSGFSNIQEVLYENESTCEKMPVISLVDLAAGYDIGNWSENEFNMFKQLHNTARGLLWVTQGASGETTTPGKALIIGLARTLGSENPEKALITVDLCADTNIAAAATAEVIVKAFKRSVVAEPGVGPRETEYRELGGKLCIPRLVPFKALNEVIEDDIQSGVKIPKPFQEEDIKELVVCLPDGQPQSLDNTSFTRKGDAAPLGPHEVEIRFSIASIQKIDVDTVMGISSRNTIGYDVQGTVLRVGSKVRRLTVGEGVVAIVPDGAIKSRLRVDQRFVFPIVGGLLLCIPSIWVTVYYALIMRCHIGPQKRVLIHRAATLLGSAAVQIATELGAEVFATVCDDEKTGSWQRKLLIMSFGIHDDNIEDCAVPGWEARLLQRTQGRKMDVVLEPGLIPCNANMVKKTGTVVQILDELELPEAPEPRQSSHSLIRLNFSDMLREEPDLVAEVLEEVHHFVRSMAGTAQMLLNPRLFKVSALQSAFQYVQKHPNMNAALAYAETSTTVDIAARLGVKALRSCIGSGTYVLAGGLGGLGRSIAQLLIDNGAKNLVFLSRSTRRSLEADLFLEDARTKGVVVKHCPVDICDAGELKRVMDEQLDGMPPVDGVVQAAAVLKDALFEKMSFADWQSAVLPKYQGTANLVKIFGHPQRKPWFLFLSSSSGIIGNRGQANYAAGNVFMDALAGSGVVQGRAVSLDIGPVLEVGMVADNAETLKRLRETGFYGIRRNDFLKIVERAIAGDVGSPGNSMPSQVILGVGTGGLIRQNKPKDPYWSRTAMYSYLNCVDMPPPDLTSTQTASATSLRALVASAADVDTRARLIGEALQKELASTVGTIKPEDVDLRKSLQSYGIDSHTSVRIRSWAFHEVGASLSTFSVLSESPMSELCQDMAKQAKSSTEVEATT